MELLKKVSILISGRGSNLRALIIAFSSRVESGIKIVQIISNVPNVPGLKIAQQAGIPTTVIDHHNYSNRRSFEEALDICLRRVGTELLCLAGFTRILTAEFVAAWPGQIVNIHPSLLPAFKGLHTHRRVLESGTRFTGCTVHFVSSSVDDGPIIAQAAVPVLFNDNEETLAARVLESEHQLYPFVLNLITSGRLSLIDNKVNIKGSMSPEIVFNPLLMSQRIL